MPTENEQSGGSPVIGLSRRHIGIGLLGLTLAVSGCARSAVPEDEGAIGPPLLGPGDRVRVTVFGEDQLTTEADIASDGNVTVPLLGPMKFAGNIPRQIETMVAKELMARHLLVDPKVAAVVIHYRQIYVLGEVTRPGGYDYQPDLSVLSAIALAGGFTRRARTTRVTVRHQGRGSEDPHPIAPGARLQPGDIIEIPERWF